MRHTRASDADGTPTLGVAALDALGHPSGGLRTVVRSRTLPLGDGRIFWAGYSFAIAFGGGGAVVGDDRGVYLLRICP